MKKLEKGFTLVELIIVIAIVIVLSVVSVPIYRSYVDKAQMSEGYALLGTILTAQKAYYSEYGVFYQNLDITKSSSFDSVLGIDARGNKYFTNFRAYGASSSDNPKVYFFARANNPSGLTYYNGATYLYVQYNLTVGARLGIGGEEDASLVE